MIGSVTVTLDSVITRLPGHIVSDMGGEKVMLSVERGKYYNLGEIGGRIWELAEQPTVLSAIVAALLDEYEVGQEDCERQVLAFVARLSDEGLLKVA